MFQNQNLNFDEYEDFILLVIECYVLVAAILKFGMKSLEDTPTEDIVTHDIITVKHDVWMLENDERKQLFRQLLDLLLLRLQT